MAADQAAVSAAGGDSSTLAGAMLAMADAPAGAEAGIDATRVDQLLGQPLQWRLPVGACAATALAILGFGALALVAARSAAAHATLALALLERSAVCSCAVPAGVRRDVGGPVGSLAASRPPLDHRPSRWALSWSPGEPRRAGRPIAAEPMTSRRRTYATRIMRVAGVAPVVAQKSCLQTSTRLSTTC